MLMLLYGYYAVLCLVVIRKQNMNLVSYSLLLLLVVNK